MSTRSRPNNPGINIAPRPDTDWWRGAVIYQIYPRSFADSNDDGVGDLPGITAKLDHVARLGADAVWLCPFFVSPQADFGYDVADHTAVDPLFGTLADFDVLVARAHALGLRVLIDQVWSHASVRHPWFLQSRADRTNARADWFVWADPSPDGTPPNNWLSVFGGSAWTWEPRRRQYYLHHFLAGQPALNLHNPEAVQAMLDVGRFWLERGVDGFRLDAIDFLMHDPGLRPNPPAPWPADGPPAKLFGLQRHVHDMLQPESDTVLAAIRSLLDEFGAVSLGEISSQDGAFGRVCHVTTGAELLHLAYTLRPLRGGFDGTALRGLLSDLQAAPHSWPCWSFSNHDVERAASRWHPRGREAGHDPDFVRLLMAVLLTLRGSVTMYQGEELGLTEAELAFEDLRDPFGIAHFPAFRGRDGSRTPMPWQAQAPNSGFSAHPAPWLPAPEAHRARAVDVQERAGGVLHDWRRFLLWRRAQPALLRGDLAMLDLPDPLVGFIRAASPAEGGQRILAVFNLSEAEVSVDLADYGALASLPASGFAPPIAPMGATLPRFGVLLASLDQALAPATPAVATAAA
jgi:alpha-glucosidase